MSNKAMNDILTRLFLDKPFRERLRTEPEQALDGYELTQVERARLFKLKRRLPLPQPNEAPSPVDPNRPFSLN